MAKKGRHPFEQLVDLVVTDPVVLLVVLEAGRHETVNLNHVFHIQDSSFARCLTARG
jgi:hypothetical protein